MLSEIIGVMWLVVLAFFGCPSIRKNIVILVRFRLCLRICALFIDILKVSISSAKWENISIQRQNYRCLESFFVQSLRKTVEVAYAATKSEKKSWENRLAESEWRWTMNVNIPLVKSWMIKACISLG